MLTSHSSGSVTISGSDVIGGVNDLLRLGIIDSPAPDWVLTSLSSDVNFTYTIFLGKESDYGW